MKVGTDGVLLGAWCRIGRREPADNRPPRALDIGAGTGLLALMVAQRWEEMRIDVDAVEIDGDSFHEARYNIGASPWAARVMVYNMSIQDFAADDRQPYDLIVSNPPYFSSSLKCPDWARTTARHTTRLTYGELIDCGARLLAEHGIFAVILPYDSADGFVALTEQRGLRLHRRTDVLPTPHSTPKRSLMEFSKTGRNSPKRAAEADTKHHSVSSPAFSHDTLTIESGERHVYSPEYIELTRDFYLKF